MGGRKEMSGAVGSRTYNFQTVRLVEGIKVLESKNKDDSCKMPLMSNTPGTSYITLGKKGKTIELRKYGDDRLPTEGFAYGQHEGVKSYHVHTWKDGKVIGTRDMTKEELKKYSKLFNKVGLVK